MESDAGILIRFTALSSLSGGGFGFRVEGLGLMNANTSTAYGLQALCSRTIADIAIRVCTVQVAVTN